MSVRHARRLMHAHMTTLRLDSGRLRVSRYALDASRTALTDSIEQVQRRVGAQPQHCGCFPAIHVVSAVKDFGLSELRASFAASLQLIEPE